VTTVQQVQVGIKMEDCKTELKILKGAEKEKLANLILEEMYKLYIENYKGLKLTGGKVSELMELWEKRTRKPFTEEDYRKRVDSLIEHLKIVDTLADFR
jgi:hypothetical protein